MMEKRHKKLHIMLGISNLDNAIRYVKQKTFTKSYIKSSHNIFPAIYGLVSINS